MKPWELFYNRQLNTPERAREIEERERRISCAETMQRMMRAQVFMGLQFIPWSDCDPEPWSKQ